MPRILLVAATTGYQTRSFAAAAKRLGIEVTLATDRCHILEDPWGDNAVPVRFDEDTRIVSASGTFDGIVAVADKPTLIASMTAQQFRVPWHPPEAVAVCRDKHQMRERFRAAGMPVPEYFRAALDSDPRAIANKLGFPCVLKPLGLSASRGVIRANDVDEFIAAFERIRRMLNEGEEAIQVERYIEGREFALEGLMTRGELRVLAIFDKPDALEGPFFEETIYVTPSRESKDVQRAMIDATGVAVRALGLWHGPIHAEMRVNDRGVYMLEVAARPIGGLCARALQFGEGKTLEEIVLLHAIGRMPETLRLTPAASGVMMIPVPRAGILESVSGVDEARKVPGIDDIVITAKIGQKLTPLPEGASYTGFIFASGEEPGAVETALRAAHARLEFRVLSSLEVL